MASSTSTVAWLSIMVERSQTVVKERTILKCSWDDSFGSLLLKFGCDDLEAETIHEVIVSEFFFCLPPGSQYKFDLSEKHKIKLEWPD